MFMDIMYISFRALYVTLAVLLPPLVADTLNLALSPLCSPDFLKPTSRTCQVVLCARHAPAHR